MSDTGEAANQLREVRRTLARPNAPRRVDLRNYVPPGSAAWQAFVEERRVPGHNVKLNTMVRWLDEVIARLDGAVLDLEHSHPPSQATVAAQSSVPTASRPSTPSADAPSAAQHDTPLRQLTPTGLAHAREFLARLRESPEVDREPPHDLLFGDAFSRPFSEEVRIERRPFPTRRDAGAYLSQALEPLRHRLADHAGVWSWLGMYYLPGTAPPTLSPNDMTFLFEPDESSAHAGRSEQQRYRHYLWGSWRLYEQNAHHADFLLDQEISSWDDISERVFGSRRVFGSAGVVPLILRLYTDGQQKKRGHVGRPGGLRHLLRVLPQLELTYDVYGMEPDALLNILPPVFREWDLNGSKA